MELDITLMTPEDCMYVYSQSSRLDGKTGCIGHLRGDFGSGQEFYITWFDHWTQYKTGAFQTELDEVVNTLRAGGGCGLLAGRTGMGRFCREHPEAGFAGNYCTEYGFKLRTSRHTYLFRCNPNKGDYNFYLYIYVSRFLEHHMEQAKRGIRFVDPACRELFCIPDGDEIRIRLPNGSHADRSCRYIDDHHVEIGYGGDNFYHIRQFAERMEQSGNTVIPLRSSLPEQCFSVLPSSGELIRLIRGEQGYSPCHDLSTPAVQRNREFADERNGKNGISKAQEAAMLAGSMFGWQVPAADPKNYDGQGQLISPKQKDRGYDR